MSNIILPTSDILLSTCSDVRRITSVLEKYGIIGFCYTKSFDDGSMIDVSDHEESTELLYCDGGLYKESAQDICPDLHKGEFFLDSCMDSGSGFSKALHTEFDVTYSLNLFQQGDGFFESVWFCTRNGTEFINFSLNSLDILKSFVNYFRKEAGAIIHKHEQDRIVRDISEEDRQKAEECIIDNSFFTSDSSTEFSSNGMYHDAVHDRYYLPTKAPVYLTPREVECLYWCVLGKTAEETGLILSLSRRTVELHLKNIMHDKLHVYSKVQLLRKAIKLNLFPNLV